MASKTSFFDNLGTWIFILGISLAVVPAAPAAEPAGAASDRRPFCHPGSPPSRHCRPARTGAPVPPPTPRAVVQTEPVEPYGILPHHVTIEQKIDKVRRDAQRSGLSPEVIEKITKDMEKGFREEEARPKPEPVATGIIPGNMVQERFGAGYPFSVENAWIETLNGSEVTVYAGAMSFDPASGGLVRYDPLTVHGFVILDKGQLGKPDFKRKKIYTPTAVGSLRIISAEGTVLVLQSRQGNKFSLNVETEQLTPLGNREPRPR